MNSGENIHNAFKVVFKTLQSVEKLISKCKAEIDDTKYYMPAEKFMRYSSDTCWEGWIYWSFILLFQRKEDGDVLDNSWIDAPIYAVEINLDSDTCDEPELIIAKMEFSEIKRWSVGCSPSNHTLFYNAIHGSELYEQTIDENGRIYLEAKEGYEEEVANRFWGFKKSTVLTKRLVDVKQENYKVMIWGSIEELSRE